MRAALICLFLLAGGMLGACAPTPTPPQTTAKFQAEYDSRWDQECASGRGQIIKPEWEAELKARLPEFQRLWASQAPAFVAEVSSLTGKQFDPESTVRLTLCDEFSNAFGGVAVNMRFALSSVTTEPVPLQYKVDITFHETLHPFIAKYVRADFPLVRAIGGETRCVRNHVHLLALQKAVLLKLSEGERLAQLIAIDSKLPSGCYKRAWSIVNQTEDKYKEYVREIAEAK